MLFGFWDPDWGSSAVHTVGVQQVMQCDYAFDFVDVRAIDYRQDFNLVRSHAFQRQIETVVGVDVREMDWIDDIAERLVGIFRRFFLQRRKIDYAHNTRAGREEP